MLSSIWEGLPVVFQEAMSAGKSTVAIDFAGINGETGYLVTPPRLEEMAERILCLLNNDAICYEMGVTAQNIQNAFLASKWLRMLHLSIELSTH